MAKFAIPSQRLQPGTAVVSLTKVENALWRLGLPILDAEAVIKYKRSAKRGMLWRAVRWQLLGIAVLISFESLGRQWNRLAWLGAAATLLACLFTLLASSDLRWFTMPFEAFRSLRPVPTHVSAMADALVLAGVEETAIGVEYLKEDPILFVKDGDKRYDLLIW